MLRAAATILQKTDYRRWSKSDSFETSWQPRTRRAAAFVPDGSRVVEFGAGERNLERYLDPSCTYVASDIIDRGPGTLICNLNDRPLPDLGAAYDVAVFLGVLEYVRDLPAVLDWLAEQVPTCVVSYVPMEAGNYSMRRPRELARRLGAGWMNSYPESQIRSLFGERGFELVRQESCIGNQLFLFSKRGTTLE